MTVSIASRFPPDRRFVGVNAQEALFDTTLELRQHTLKAVILLLNLSAWLWLLGSNLIWGILPIETILLVFAVEIIGAVSFVMCDKHPSLAVKLLIIGTWLCNVTAAYLYHQPIFFYLFSLVILIASIMVRRRYAMILTLASCACIIGLSTRGGWTWDLLPPVLLVAFTWLTSLIVFQNFYELLLLAWHYQDYAIQQMEEAREHRGKLMQLTKALLDAQQDLTRANNQLQHARKMAEESRRLKAQFAANVSHELRTPINLVVGFAEMMMMNPQAYGQPLSSKYWADMNTIYRSAKHLQSLIDDVLDVSQINAGQMAIIREYCDASEIILEAANLARDLVESKNLTFHVAVPSGLPTMYLDRLRIRQVIINLLSNAARYTDTGTIRLSARIEGRYLQISVSDTGIGIAADELKRVFEEFRQSESQLARGRGGTGLGLTLSRQFIELHGGRIGVESEGIPGKGSTFYVCLPLAGEPGGRETTVPTTASTGSDDGRYFVVLSEDRSVVKLFERHTAKHHAVGAYTLKDALNLVNTIYPSAVVVDNLVNKWNPVEHLHRVTPQLPVITCAMPSNAHASEIYGIADYLIKPVSYQMLADALSRLPTTVRKVLIVDDNPDMVRILSRMLDIMPQSYQVLKAYRGMEGLLILQDLRPDLVLLDLQMPDMDGFTVIQQIRSDPSLAFIPIIAISAASPFDDLSAMVEGEITIAKSTGFQTIELIQCVEALIDSFVADTVPA